MTLKEFFELRRKRKKELQFYNGYNFAAGALLKGTNTPMELENMIPHEVGSFDRGMMEAIDTALDFGIIEDDRVV